MQKIINKYGVLILVLLGYSILFVVCAHDPFYGDAKSTISRLAVQTYYSNFKIIFYPQGLDPGHPVLFPMMHAALWKVFGTSLIVSHCVTYFFSLLLLIAAYKVDVHYRLKGILLLFVACNPIILALSASLNTHIVLAACTLWYYLFYLNKKVWGMVCIASLMLLTHNEGLLIFVAFMAAQIIVDRKLPPRLLIAFTPWLAWLFIHQHYTGWFLFPPEYDNFRGLGKPLVLVKNIGIIAWRLLDFGLFLITLTGLYAIFKNRKKEFFVPLTFSFLLILAIWATVKFAIAHRYFIPVFLLMSIPAAHYFLKQKGIYLLICILVLLSGSFWYYPGKQLSDANLMYRNYFNIYDEISKSNFADFNLYSTAPNESSAYITHIAPKKFNGLLKIKNINDKSHDPINAVIESNLNGTLPDSIKNLIAHWPYKTYESGPAYINVYVSPNLAPSDHSGEAKNWHHRRVGAFEQWLKSLKSKLQP